jgi:hypothetical protein
MRLLRAGALTLILLLGGCPGRSDTASGPASVDASTHEAKVPMVHDLTGAHGRARGGLLDDIAHASQRPEASDEPERGDRAFGASLHIERLWQPRHRQRSTGG